MPILLGRKRDFHIMLCMLIIGCTGCALTPQKIEIKPQLQVAKTRPVGEDREVSVVVVDLRPSDIIGNRGLTRTLLTSIRQCRVRSTPCLLIAN